MNLWFSSLILLAGLSMSRTSPTAEECQALVNPHTTFKPMYGRWTFILGYSDNPVLDAMFRSAKSMWIDFHPTDDPNVMMEDIGIRHPSYCKYASTPITVFGNSAVSQKSNFSCHYRSIPTSRGCLLYHVLASNNNNLIEPTETPTEMEELSGYKTFYLMCTKRTITPAELVHAKKQAECLGFKGEPTYHYSPNNTFCHEGFDV